MPKLDYEKVIKQKWKENAKAVPKLIEREDKDILRQVKTYCDRFDEPSADVKNKILNDSLFANCFAKDPVRQTSHEKIAFEYLQKSKEVLNKFCKLPQSGQEAVYLTNDGIFQKYSQTGKRIGKALDFYWENGENVFYASHKYTKESGGAQDHQFNEQAELLRKFKENNKNNEFLFIICDGRYYTKDKVEFLNALTSKRSFVAGIEQVISKVLSMGVSKNL
ncbi:MAG: hypothetical protein LBO62_01860 [Endomicrobium sp.]|jgi:hypothetical protein|nr:hypothetical protein [Endomicrobium sp.]